MNGEGSFNKNMDKPYVPSIPKIAPVKFVGEVIAELRKVTWPTRGETIKLTAVVLAISVIVGAFIGGLDWVFLKITSVIFQR